MFHAGVPDKIGQAPMADRLQKPTGNSLPDKRACFRIGALFEIAMGIIFSSLKKE
jgi:hypothetical protein